MQIYSESPVKKGKIIILNDNKKTYEVQSCIDLDWLYKGEQKGYLLQLKEVNALTK